MGNLSRASDTEKEFPVPYLFECFSVDFVKGELKWLSRPRSHFKTDMAFNTVNSRQSGKPVGSIASNGYAVVGLREPEPKGKSYINIESYQQCIMANGLMRILTISTVTQGTITSQIYDLHHRRRIVKTQK